ncbi:class I SAM-dependent methyltransferase [Algoriphagus namhaensis]|uniref:Class I SAM-dependent methyltransferase n=1 Tax=Algoriphagus namhaensis TaxID=915353 RepID=A0ABV8APP9_9BACT
MLESLTQCPLCSTKEIRSVKTIIDHAVSQESFQVLECTSCRLLFTSPRPLANEIGPYYEFDEYYSHSDDAGGLIPTIYQQVKQYSIKQKIKQLNQFVTKGTLLDYGCGTGEFILQASKQEWSAFGIEPNDKARAIASTKLKEKVYASLQQLIKGLKFDVITLYHVLEHIHELDDTVNKLLSHLNPGGYIFIAVPNPESPDAQLYKEYWAGWDVPRHLYHFTHQAMMTFGEKFGLEHIESKPLKFDSFYVSLLSEGYQSPKQSKLKTYFQAFKNGLNSNIQASKAKRPSYSSNLYIFRKP